MGMMAGDKKMPAVKKTLTADKKMPSDKRKPTAVKKTLTADKKRAIAFEEVVARC